MEQIRDMEEINLASNLRLIIMKPPYKLRERWRVTVCDLQEQRGYRVSFKDLVQFIESQHCKNVV